LYRTQTLVIGDDPTGCNLTGAIFTKKDFSALTAWDVGSAKKISADFDVILFDTNTRHLSPLNAYQQVSEILEDFGVLGHLAKRIDSTLRGNLGPEVQAILDRLRGGDISNSVQGLVVSAFPDAMRTTRNGEQYVNGSLLTSSPVSADPLNPIVESDVGSLMTANTSLTASYIFLDVVRDSVEVLSKHILSQETDLIIFDSETNEDIGRIVSALNHLGSVNRLWVTVDPGPFTVAYLNSVLRSRLGKTKRHALRESVFLFAFIGSSTELTRQQIEFSKRHSSIAWLSVNTRSDSIDSILEQISILAESGVTNIGLVVDYSEGSGAGDRYSEYHQSDIALATIASEIIEQIEPRGIYTSGGDTTLAILKALGAQGLQVTDEVFSGAVAGILVGGKSDGMSIVTKGGLMGSEDGISQAFTYLNEVSNVQVTTMGKESRRS
jgi:uncharacterized protein YgbK (DUF1537 family)